MDTKPETQETPSPTQAEKLSPEQKNRIQSRIQGLGADISQAEEAKAEALNQVGAAMKAGNLESAEKWTQVAHEADQASSNMQIEQMDLQTQLEAEKAEETASPDTPPKPKDDNISIPVGSESPEKLRNQEYEHISGKTGIEGGG